MAPTVGMVDRSFIPRTGKQVKSLQLPMASSQVNRQLCPPAYLLLHHGTQYNSQERGGTQEGHSLTSCISTVWSSLTLPFGISLVQISCSVMSHSLWPDGLQHTRTPCPLPTPGDCSDSCPLSGWYHPIISSSTVLFSSCPQSFPASGACPVSQILCIRWPKYWSFSISPSNEYSGLISFQIDWFDLAVQGTQESSPTPQFKSINSSVLSFLYGSTFTSIYDYWKSHSFEEMDLCWQSNVSAF